MNSIKQEIVGDDSQIYNFPGRSKSSVWNHFGFQKGPNGMLDKSRAVCKICRQGIRYSGNTTNLHCHLTKHRRENYQFGNLDESWMQPSPDNKYDFKIFDSIVQSTVEDTKTGTVQPSTSSNDEIKSRPKHQQLNDTIVNFFIEHLLPLSVVESTSFYSMIAVADPMYVIPDRETLYGNLIQQTFLETKRSIEIELSENSVMIYAEVWQSITGEMFLSIFGQLINSSWQMKTFLLKTTAFNEISNVDSFSLVFNSLIADWKIEKPIAFLYDGSEQMQNALASKHLVSMQCFTGILHTVGDNLFRNQEITKSVTEFVIQMVGNALQSETPLKGKIYEIVKDYKEIKVQSVRWTTFTTLFQCALDHKDVILSSILSTEKRNDDVWQQISDMTNVVNPMLKAYNLLTQKSTVISSMILPVLCKLEQEMTLKQTDSEFTKLLKKTTWAAISEPFQSQTVKNFLLVCSLLDPRYKDLQFVEGTDSLRAREILGTEATEIYREGKDSCVFEGEVIVVEESGNVIRIEPMEKRQKLDTEVDGANAMDAWLSDVVCKDKPLEKGTDMEEKVMVEIDHYISTSQVSTSPLQWWSSRESIYPTLSRLARRYLCMQNFRISENQTILHAQLSTDTIDQLLVLHHHYYCK